MLISLGFFEKLRGRRTWCVRTNLARLMKEQPVDRYR